MKNSNNTCKIIKLCNIFFSFTIIILLYILIAGLLKYTFIFVDDSDTTLFYSLKKIFINDEYTNGLIIPSILEKLFGIYIPYYVFKIHPSDFKSEYFSYIEALLIIIFCFIPIKIMFLNKNENIIYKLPIIIYLFIISFYFYSLKEPMLMLFTYDGFFRLNMPIFLFLLLFCYLIKINNKITFKNYIIILFLPFICCLSNELICVTTVIGTLIYIFLSLYNRISNKRFYCLLTVLIMSISGILLLIKFGAFTRKSPDIILDLNYFISLFKILPVFIKEYIKYIFLKHYIGYILLISQIIILFFKTKERNSINIVLSYLTGLLIFFLLLIGLGQYPCTDIKNRFWVMHPDIQTMYDIILLSFNLYLFSLIIKNKIFKNYIFYIVLISLVITSGFFTYQNIIFYKDTKQNFLIPIKEVHYKTEKIIRLANLKKNTIYIDSEIFNNGFNWAFFYNINEEHKKDIIYSDNAYIKFLNNFGGNITQKVIFTDKEIADKEFKSNGGVFTDEELKNIKFSRLMDKNFLLNKK